jgi:hypothetical protein
VQRLLCDRDAWECDDRENEQCARRHRDPGQRVARMSSSVRARLRGLVHSLGEYADCLGEWRLIRQASPPDA